MSHYKNETKKKRFSYFYIINYSFEYSIQRCIKFLQYCSYFSLFFLFCIIYNENRANKYCHKNKNSENVTKRQVYIHNCMMILFKVFSQFVCIFLIYQETVWDSFALLEIFHCVSSSYKLFDLFVGVVVIHSSHRFHFSTSILHMFYWYIE